MKNKSHILYPDHPHIIPMEKDRYGNIYYIEHGYIYLTDAVMLIVNENFRYDGASVPRIAWGFSGFTPDGLLRAAALVHDCIYIANGKSGEYEGFKFRSKLKLKLTRKDADKLFYKIMLESGVKKWRAKLAYRAVRIGGAFYRKF